MSHCSSAQIQLGGPFRISGLYYIHFQNCVNFWFLNSRALGPARYRIQWQYKNVSCSDVNSIQITLDAELSQFGRTSIAKNRFKNFQPFQRFVNISMEFIVDSYLLSPSLHHYPFIIGAHLRSAGHRRLWFLAAWCQLQSAYTRWALRVFVRNWLPVSQWYIFSIFMYFKWK